MSVSGSNMDLIDVASLTVTNNISHGGLTMTTGTNIDQVKLVSVNATVLSSTPVTILTGGTLATGSYFVQIYINTGSIGGGIWLETYSGYMSWYSGATNDGSSTTNVPLHNTGHAQTTSVLTLRTVRPSSGTARLEFVINNAQPNYTYNWYFRRFM